jgi:F-type H+-transporting ATPase subunit delta
MAEPVTLARPYAQAAFDYARKADKMSEWTSALRTAADIAADPKFSSLIDDPRFSTERLQQLVFDIGGDDFTPDVQNFLRTMADNGRLAQLPHVSDLYEQLCNAEQNRIDVEVVSAYAVKKDQQHRIAEALEKRLGKSVELHTRIDKSLIGGAIIRVGDQVIDGSLAGGLKQLANQLHSS